LSFRVASYFTLLGRILNVSNFYYIWSRLGVRVAPTIYNLVTYVAGFRSLVEGYAGTSGGNSPVLRVEWGKQKACFTAGFETTFSVRRADQTQNPEGGRYLDTFERDLAALKLNFGIRNLGWEFLFDEVLCIYWTDEIVLIFVTLL
jgi:hypothetical protein